MLRLEQREEAQPRLQKYVVSDEVWVCMGLDGDGDRDGMIQSFKHSREHEKAVLLGVITQKMKHLT